MSGAETTGTGPRWDPRFRRLHAGETILATDECQRDDGSWVPAVCVGGSAPDPNYTSHRVYRRLLADAPVAVERRYLSDRFRWAAPGDRQHDVWIVRFDDNDVRDMVFEGAEAEAEAWAAWERHAPGYNMRVFRLATLASASAGDQEPDPFDDCLGVHVEANARRHGLAYLRAAEVDRECQAVWRSALADAVGALDVLTGMGLHSRRENDRAAGAVLGAVLDALWSAREPAARSYREAFENGKALIGRIPAIVDQPPQ